MTFPNIPGWKGSIETGREAAIAYTPKAKTWRAKILEDLASHGPSTAEQVAERLDYHWYLTRPRISELKADGLVVDTGGRMKSAMGGKTAVVRVATADERARFLAAVEAKSEQEASQ